MLIWQCKYRNVKQEKSKYLKEIINLVHQLMSHCLFIYRRELNPPEQRKKGSKSKHVGKFSNKKPKGGQGKRNPKQTSVGRKRR